MIKALIIVLLAASLVHGAQPQPSITIPQGTTVYGPFSVSALHRYVEIALIPQSWSTANTKLLVVIDRFDGKTWDYLCHFRAEKPIIATPIIVPCPLFDAVYVGGKRQERRKTVTQIRATATATNGSITLKLAPTVGSK